MPSIHVYSFFNYTDSVFIVNILKSFVPTMRIQHLGMLQYLMRMADKHVLNIYEFGICAIIKYSKHICLFVLPYLYISKMLYICTCL